MAFWWKTSFASSTPLHEWTASETGAGHSLVILPCRGCFAGMLRYSSSPSLSARASSIFTEEDASLSARVVCVRASLPAGCRSPGE